MKTNIGTIDRIVRLLIAITFSVLYFTGIIVGNLGFGLLAVSAIMVMTSMMSSCPFYSIFGISSCNTKNEDEA